MVIKPIDNSGIDAALAAVRAILPPDMSSFTPELEIDVWYDFQPPERATLEYPGCDASATITCIQYNGVDITEGVRKDAPLWDELENECTIDGIEKAQDYAERGDF